MIRKVVDFALENRFLVLAAALLLFGLGTISFRHLPVEAYPDVADNHAEIITQWPLCVVRMRGHKLSDSEEAFEG